MQQTARAGEPPFQKGVCYAHTWSHGGRDGYGSDASERSLEHLKSLGVGWISLTPFGFMPSLRSTEIITFQPASGESDERLAHEAARAHGLGLKVALKPHLWIRGGAWPGEIEFPDGKSFQKWFASYRAFILRYAELAERESFDLLVMGTELKSATARDPKAFRALVADLRRVYHGPITYAANWDEAERVPFWDALDVIGVQAYAPVAKKENPTMDELRAGWKPIVDGLGRLAKRFHRKVVLTELGYRAARDAAMAPATWPRPGHDVYAPDVQADCYRAAFESLWGKPWLDGVYIWKWFTDSRDEEGPTDFSPAGKPAEKVLGEFYQRAP